MTSLHGAGFLPVQWREFRSQLRAANMRSRIFVHDLFPPRCHQLTQMERSKFFLLRCKRRLGLHSEFAPKIVANVAYQLSPRPRSLLLAWNPPKEVNLWTQSGPWPEDAADGATGSVAAPSHPVSSMWCQSLSRRHTPVILARPVLPFIPPSCTNSAQLSWVQQSEPQIR